MAMYPEVSAVFAAAMIVWISKTALRSLEIVIPSVIGHLICCKVCSYLKSENKYIILLSFFLCIAPYTSSFGFEASSLVKSCRRNKKKKTQVVDKIIIIYRTGFCHGHTFHIFVICIMQQTSCGSRRTTGVRFCKLVIDNKVWYYFKGWTPFS
jgi:hypothetical protein